MRREFAEKTLAFIENECKSKLENEIRNVLAVRVDLEFSIEEMRYGNYYIKAKDAYDNVNDKMTCNPLLKQLFESAELVVNVYANDEVEEQGVFFNIGVSYKHGYNGGSNGHDLMAVAIDSKGNVEVRK